MGCAVEPFALELPEEIDDDGGTPRIQELKALKGWRLRPHPIRARRSVYTETLEISIEQLGWEVRHNIRSNKRKRGVMPRSNDEVG